MIMIMEDNTISEKIKKRRLEAGLSLSQLARRANTSVATLSRYENGWQRFELYTLRKLATAMGCRLRLELEPMEPSSSKRQRASSIRELQRLFWDRRLRSRDLDQYPLWVLERVLEYGSLEDVRSLAVRMGQKRFLERVAEVQFKSARTENFWHLILQREGVSCTKRFSRKEARSCWPG
jgi:transcriptional regulator with XRE-family HTH domain